MSRRQRMAAVVGGTVLLVAATGCPIIIPTPPEAVLQGTWELTGDLVSPDVTDFLMIFNADGRIVEIRYVFENATVIIPANALLNSSSDVNGNNVTISATWALGNTFTFQGTFNDAKTVITGTTFSRLVIGAAIIEIPTGPATLTKV
jgi:hypothetical protein